MKRLILFFLSSLLPGGQTIAQNVLWEDTRAKDDNQNFSDAIDLGNDYILLAGQDWSVSTLYLGTGSVILNFWQLINTQTGDTILTRYWEPRKYGFPYPFASDKNTQSIVSFVRYVNQQGYDSVRSIQARAPWFSTVLWETYYDPSFFATPGRYTRTMPAIDGGYIDCRERSVQGSISQSRVAKFDGTGNLLWQQQYGPAGHRCFTSWIDVTHDSCYIISGIQRPLWAGSTDSTWCFLQKIDRNGVPVWRKTFVIDPSLPIKDAFTARFDGRETPDGGYLFVGSFATSQAGYSLTAKFDSTLSSEGRKWYMPIDSTVAYGEGYADGTCMLAGSRTSLNLPFVVRRTGPNGETLSKKVFNDPCRAATSIVFNSDSTAILAGWQSSINCFASSIYYDFWWCKIDGMGIPYNPLTVNKEQIPRAHPVESMELWPNPAGEQITLRLPSFKGSNVQVINTLGQTVVEQPITSLRPQIDVQHLPQGVYRVRVGGWVKTFVKQ